MQTQPLGVIALYGAKPDTVSHKLLALLSQTMKHVKFLALDRDHALPLKKHFSSSPPSERVTSPSGEAIPTEWTKKHQEQIPGAILLCFEVPVLSQQTIQACTSHWERVRENVSTTGRALLPVSLALVCTKPGTEEERQQFLAQLRRATAQPATLRMNGNASASPFLPPSLAVLFASDFDASKPMPAIQRLGADVQTGMLEYYHQEIARLKASKALPGANLARLEFKCAQYYEMRALPSKALAHYLQAYQQLCLARSLASSSKRGAEFVHYRIQAIRLQTAAPQDARAALGQLRIHLTLFPADPEWQSRQHLLFASLLQQQPSNLFLSALDQVERERLSPSYHFSRAAVFASKLELQQNTPVAQASRALELFEKLFARRQQQPASLLLLTYIARERARAGDVAGAQRDYMRAATSVATARKQHASWDALQAALVAKCCGDESLALNENTARLVLLHPQRFKAQNLATAARKLVLESTTAVVDARGLCQAVWDVANARLLVLLVGSALAEDVWITACGKRVLDRASIAPLFLDCVNEEADMPTSTTAAAADGGERIAIKLRSGAEWSVPLQRVSSARMDQLLLPIMQVTSEEEEDKGGMEIELEGIPNDHCVFVGETFTLRCVTNNKLTGQSFTCVEEEGGGGAGDLRITQLGGNEFQILVSAPANKNALGSEATLCFSSKTSRTTTTSTRRRQRRTLTLRIFPALRLITTTTPSLQNKARTVTIECPNHGQALSCTNATCDALLGAWQGRGERRTLLCPNNTEEILIEMTRSASHISFSLPLLRPNTSTEEEEAQQQQQPLSRCELTWSSSEDGVASPIVRLGEEFKLRLRIVAGSSLARFQVALEPSSCFAICGAMQQATTHVFPNQTLDLDWKIIARNTGPGKLPAVWVETSSRQLVECSDRNVLVI